MPIGFARCVFVQRSRGHSVLAAAAYIGRARLAAPYPHFDYTDRQDLLAPMQTLLPQAAPERLHDPFALWHEVELTSPRKDSSLGLHLMLALPAPKEMAAQLCAPLVREFIQTVIMPHELAASFAIHNAHEQGIEQAMAWLEIMGQAPRAPSGANLSRRNRHAHVLISPRRVGADGIEPRRYTALDPTQVSLGSEIRGVALGGIDWPELWLRHQNDFFARHGLGLRVRPWAAFSDYHRGNERTAKRKDNIADEGPNVGNRAVERANRATMSEPAKLLALAGRRPFTEPDLRGLVERYVGLGHPYDRNIADVALALPHVVRLGDQHSSTALPWFATHELARREQSCIVLAARLMDTPGTPNFNTLELTGKAACVNQGRLTIVETNAGLLMPPTDIDFTISPQNAARLIGIDHGWGILPGIKRSVSPNRLQQRLQPSDVLILDYADTMAADHLLLLFRATLEVPNTHLVLLRRRNGALHPRNPLIDIVAQLIGFDPKQEHYEREAGQVPLITSGVERMIDDLQARGNIVFVARADLLTTATDITNQLRRTGRQPSVMCPDHELAALMRLNRLRVNHQTAAENQILIHCNPSFGNLTILPLHAEVSDPILLVDRTYCPDLESLRAQLTSSTTALCALALPMVIDDVTKMQSHDGSGEAGHRAIRWAVDRDGNCRSTPEHIQACLQETYALQIAGEETGENLPTGAVLGALIDQKGAGSDFTMLNQSDQIPEAPEDVLAYNFADVDDDPDPDSAFDVAEFDASEADEPDDSEAATDEVSLSSTDDQ